MQAVIVCRYDYSFSFLGWAVSTKSPFDDPNGGLTVRNEVSEISGHCVQCWTGIFLS